MKEYFIVLCPPVSIDSQESFGASNLDEQPLKYYTLTKIEKDLMSRTNEASIVSFLLNYFLSINCMFLL